jgi:hypothetical protein
MTGPPHTSFPRRKATGVPGVLSFGLVHGTAVHFRLVCIFPEGATYATTWGVVCVRCVRRFVTPLRLATSYSPTPVLTVCLRECELGATGLPTVRYDAYASRPGTRVGGPAGEKEKKKRDSRSVVSAASAEQRPLPMQVLLWLWLLLPASVVQSVVGITVDQALREERGAERKLLPAVLATAQLACVQVLTARKEYIETHGEIGVDDGYWIGDDAMEAGLPCAGFAGNGTLQEALHEVEGKFPGRAPSSLTDMDVCRQVEELLNQAYTNRELADLVDHYKQTFAFPAFCRGAFSQESTEGDFYYARMKDVVRGMIKVTVFELDERASDEHDHTEL